VRFLGSGKAASMMLAGVLAFGANAVWILIVGAASTLVENPASPPSDEFTGWLATLMFLSPLIATFLLLTWEPLRLTAQHSHYGDAFFELMLEWLPRYAIPLCTCFCVGIILAVYCYCRHRRYEERGAFAWAVFVLLLGVPGYVGYLLHRNWPTKEVCQHCGKTSPRDRDTCLHCHTAFPVPAMKGIEILA
jgi:hypothetical protein